MSDLPPGWEWAILENLADWGSGGTPKAGTREYYGGSIPWAVIGDLNDSIVQMTANTITRRGLDESSAKLVPVGAILIAMYGSIGKLGISGVEMATNQAIAFARSREVYPKYLFWYLMSQRHQLNQVGKGATQKNISQTILRGWPVPVAPLAEQRRIVAALEAHLSRLDAGLAYVRIGLRRIDALARRMIIEAVPVPGPTHWRCVMVGEAGHVDLGRQRHPDWHTGPNMRPYLRVANIFEDRIDLKDVKSMNFPPDVFDRFKLHPGDILLNEGQSPEYLGRPAMYCGKPDEFAFTNSLLRFRAQPDVLPEWALLVFRRHMHARRFIKEVRITTNIAHLSAARFKSVEFPIPPLDEQKLIVAKTKESLSGIARMSTALDTADRRADKLRCSLLADAFAGRLVPQDSKEEPASVLLERIRTERAAQFKLKHSSRTKHPDTTQEALL